MGLRESPETRQKMHEWFLDEVKRRPEPVVHLRGTLEERLATAQEAIRDIMKTKIIQYA